MRTSQTIFNTVFILMVLFVVYSCIRWEWNECRKVGHSVAYCLTHEAN